MSYPPHFNSSADIEHYRYIPREEIDEVNIALQNGETQLTYLQYPNPVTLTAGTGRMNNVHNSLVQVNEHSELARNVTYDHMDMQQQNEIHDYHGEASTSRPSSIRPSSSCTSGGVNHINQDNQHHRGQLLQHDTPDHSHPLETTESFCDLGEIVTYLEPKHVRWFYKGEGEKKWNEFDGYDSLRIEEKYRERMSYYNSVTTCVNFNYDCEQTNYENDYQSTDTTQHSMTSSYQNYNYENYLHDFGYEHGVIEEKIPVRGGLYDVDLATWKCVPIYWPGDEFDITRGTWFNVSNWQPLKMEECAKLEEEHLGQFGGHRVTEYDSPRSLQAIHTVEFPQFNVDWLSPREIYLYYQGKPSKIMKSVSQKLGFTSAAGYQLSRGYRTEADYEDKPPDISHIVFVIHGIGHKMDTGRIIRNCSTFRESVTWLKQKYFSSLEQSERIELFPVEWRSALKLDGDVVEAITPQQVLGLRHILNSTAMDIMYYTSPLYRGEVQDVLRNELNRLYTLICQRNSGFQSNGGKVSILSHSLGCVITYDIITQWSSLREAAYITWMKHGRNKPFHHSEVEPKLLFEVDHFFCLGSPLAVFIAMRFRDPQKDQFRDLVLPKALCQRMYNIFHPADPVAYRMEPLFIDAYKRVAPLLIKQYTSGSKNDYDTMPRELIPKLQPKDVNVNVDSNGRGLKDGEHSGPASPKSPSTPSKENSWSLGLWNIMSKVNWGPDQQNSVVPVAATINSHHLADHIEQTIPLPGPPQRVASPPTVQTAYEGPVSPISSITEDLEYRLDYALRESNLTSGYLAAITAHTGYWANYDVANFVLTMLHSSDNPDYESASTTSN